VSTGNHSHSTSSLCWNCNAELDSPYRCDRCVKIQPWPDGIDFFSFLGLPRRLRIDLDSLDERFLKLSRVFHPDFFQDSDDEERDISLVNAARLNRAYNVLKDPASRAGYILELELGTKLKHSKNVPPEIAAEIMDLQESLAEFAALDENQRTASRARDRLTAQCSELEEKYNRTLEELDALFKEYDEAMDNATSPMEPQVRKQKESILTRIDRTLTSRLYLKRILDNVAATLEGKDVNLL
jgi:molecular chaperone HscB